jgi:hypothetical protein
MRDIITQGKALYGQHRASIYLGVLLVIALLVILLLFTREDKNVLKVQEQEVKIKELQLKIVEVERQKMLEVVIRQILRREDSVTIKKLVKAKKKDSLTFVTKIKDLQKKYKEYTPDELDEQLWVRIELEVPGSSPISPTEDRQKVIKEWCLATYDQNHQLWQSVEAKTEVMHQQDTLIDSLEKRVSSYERDSLLNIQQNALLNESLVRKDTIIFQQGKTIKKLKLRSGIKSGIIVAILTLFAL